MVAVVNLEKDFDVARLLAIQETLIHKGMGSRLLVWVGNYFRYRTLDSNVLNHSTCH